MVHATSAAAHLGVLLVACDSKLAIRGDRYAIEPHGIAVVSRLEQQAVGAPPAAHPPIQPCCDMEDFAINLGPCCCARALGMAIA